MLPKITISQGERQIEVNLSDRELHHVLDSLNYYSANKLINPRTGEPYESQVTAEAKLTELGESIDQVLDS